MFHIVFNYLQKEDQKAPNASIELCDITSVEHKGQEKSTYTSYI